MVFISPDLPKQNRKTKGKFKLDFELYSDNNNQLAKKLGIAFKLGKNTSVIYKEKFKIDLEKAQGNQNDELPFAGVYIIGKDGVIKFAHMDSNYKERIPASKILSMVKSLK